MKENSMINHSGPKTMFLEKTIMDQIAKCDIIFERNDLTSQRTPWHRAPLCEAVSGQ